MKDAGSNRTMMIGAGDSTWSGNSATPSFGLQRADKWLPNLERMLDTLAARGLDGLVLHLRPNVFYMSGYASRVSASRHEHEGLGAVVISRTAPMEAVLIAEITDFTYFLNQPTWIEDIRTYVPWLLPPDPSAESSAFDRFVSTSVRSTTWGARARETIAEGFLPACRKAMTDLGLMRARVGFDDLGFAANLRCDEVDVVNAVGTMKFIRQIKTPEEVRRLRQAHAVNEIAIANTIASWSQGMRWSELSHIYDLNCVALGAYPQYGGGMILANAEEIVPTFHSWGGESDDFVVEPGMSLMIDCHGYIDQYRWDGGKTWVVDDERQGDAVLIQRAAIEAARVVQDRLRPGAGVNDVIREARGVFKTMGVPEWDRALVFFHGMGLDGTDIEIKDASMRPNWRLEKGMAIATHVAFPGDSRSRFYIEDVEIVRPDGGESLFSWDFEPHPNSRAAV